MKKYFLALAIFLPLLALLIFPSRSEAAEVTLTVSINGSGTVTSPPDLKINCGTDCSEPYDSATLMVVTLHAEPEAGSGLVFAGWSGACSNNTGDCQITMTDNKIVTAIFANDFRPPFYNSPNCTGNAPGDIFDPACWLPINVSSISQIKLGGLSVGSPSLGGLIVDAGAYIRGNLVLPPAAGTPAPVGSVLTLMDSTGTTGWTPLSPNCVNVSTTTPNTETSRVWKTATTTPCQAGYKVTGGGIRLQLPSDEEELHLYDLFYSESYKSPSSEAWVGRLRGEGFDATVYARCCKF